MSLGKAIFATALGALVTGGVVYVVLNPDLREQLTQPAKIEGQSEAGNKVDELVGGNSSEDIKPSDVDKDVEVASEEEAIVETEIIREDIIVSEDIDVDAVVSTKPSEDSGPRLGNPDLRPVQSMDSDTTPKTTSSDVVERLIDEAERIEDAQFREQAYLNVVDFAVSQGDMAGAESVLPKIENIEYRFTAVSRIVTAYAQAGKADKAFALIDTIDDPEFADILRMQAIENLSAGKNAE